MSTMSNQQSYSPGSDEVNLMELFHQLWANKWLIMILTTLMLLLGTLYLSRQVPQYRSNVLLQMDSKQSGMGQSGGSMQQFFGGSSGDSGSTQIALIQSRFILGPVIKSLGLDLNISPTPTSLWARFFSSPTSNMISVSSFHVPRELFNKKLNVKIDKPGHFILSDTQDHVLLQGAVGTLLTTPDRRIRLQVDLVKAPIGAQFMLTKQSEANVMQALLKVLTIEEAGNDSSQRTGVFNLSLRGETPSKIVRTLNEMAKTTQVKDAEKKALEASQTLDFLYKQLPITKALLEKAEHSLNQYRSKSGKIDIKFQIQFLLNQLADLSKQQGTLRLNKIEMLQEFTSVHPTLVALNAQIKALEVQQDELQRKLNKLPESDQIAVNLMRDVKVKQSLYLLLLNKIQELQVVKAATISGVRILSYATLPDAPLPGKKMLTYLASVLLGMMISILIIFGRKLMFPRVDDPNWIEHHFNLPNLATVPFCKEQTENSRRFDGSKQLPLLAHINPRNLAIESLRSLRTSLQVTLTCATNNVISIMGVSPGMGKSFVSANLAYLLAAGGKRVLLIDGDLRRGTMHKYFNLSPSPGLAEVVSDGFPLDQALQTSIFHSNLTMLPRGVYPKDPSELLMSDRFKALIESFSKQFDLVVIDTPPVLLVTDAVLIGLLSATNYLVMGAGAHQPGELELAIKRFSGAGVAIQGSIFNFHRAGTKSHYYGGKYYNSNYSYYHDETLKT